MYVDRWYECSQTPMRGETKIYLPIVDKRLMQVFTNRCRYKDLSQ
jgi:hypothetical protein